MKYVIRALQWKLHPSPYPLIRLWLPLNLVQCKHLPSDCACLTEVASDVSEGTGGDGRWVGTLGCVAGVVGWTGTGGIGREVVVGGSEGKSLRLWLLQTLL